MPDLSPFNPNQPLDARVLRMLVDGELDAADQARVQALIEADHAMEADLRRTIDSERQLRAAVGRTMSVQHAPASLRSQIEQSMQQTWAANADESAVIGRIERSAPAASHHRRASIRRFFASPHHANIAAVAAVVALIAGAVLFGIYGRTIDDVPVQRTDVVGNAAQFVDGEHTQCTKSPEHIQKQAVWHTAKDAVVGLTELLGVPAKVFDLTSVGYEFVGAGRCEVPLESQPSGHLIYRKSIDGKPGPMVSVFVAPVRGCCEGFCAGLPAKKWVAANASSKRRVLYSTDGRLVYFLVCCDEGDLPAVADAISRAEPAASR